MNNTHDIIDDRIDVVTRGLLGLTVTCARCHDHKFDPIPSADYYSLYGVFRSSTEPTVPPLAGRRRRRDDHVLYDAELTIREKKLVDFVTAKHTELVTRRAHARREYLLAAHAARNQPPADDFMLLADPGDLNPSMINRWRQYLDRHEEAPRPGLAALARGRRVARRRVRRESAGDARNSDRREQTRRQGVRGSAASR